MEVMQETAATGNSQVLLWLEKELAVIRLGSPNDRVVLLNEERMDSLARAIDTVRAQPGIKGLVIIGAQDRLFCAGADINLIRSVDNSERGRQLARRGQEIFEQIEQLPFTTVAAISGACVGGGCELALACKYRVVTDLPQTRIGLPEIKLGIIPGFGGSQRLPRLIGIRNALDIILKGKLLDAKQARAMGLADLLIVPTDVGNVSEAFEMLEAEAVAIALGKKTLHPHKMGFIDSLLTHTAPGRRIVYAQAKRMVEKESGGNYPAPPRALQVLFTGLAEGLSKGFSAEADAIGELIVTPESKALVHLFLLSEESGKLGRNAKLDPSELRVAVVGAGTMGAGIASVFIGAGAKVLLFDTIEAARNRARSGIQSGLEKRRSLSPSMRTRYLQNLTLVSSLDQIKDASLVIEAVIEDPKLKRELLQSIVKLVDAKAIIASNTSSLSVSEMAKDLDHPERVIGMHFFNPVPKMPLVELVQARSTNERTIVHSAACVALLGKFPVVVTDVPGFLVNRILSPYLVEASHLLAEGLNVEEVDRQAVRFGMPMGPFRLLDEIGLDVAAKVADVMESSYGPRMKGPNYAAQLVGVGRLGKKSGKGFYRYRDGKQESDPDLASLLPLKADPTRTAAARDVISSRLILAMVNEAVRCFDDGVAGAPGREAAGQIDLAAVMGLGFPPFRGGVIRYAAALGAQTVCQSLLDFEKRFGERFSPAPGIQARAKNGISFYDKLP